MKEIVLSLLTKLCTHIVGIFITGYKFLDHTIIIFLKERRCGLQITFFREHEVMGW